MSKPQKAETWTLMGIAGVLITAGIATMAITGAWAPGGIVMIVSGVALTAVCRTFTYFERTRRP